MEVLISMIENDRVNQWGTVFAPLILNQWKGIIALPQVAFTLALITVARILAIWMSWMMKSNWFCLVSLSIAMRRLEKNLLICCGDLMPPSRVRGKKVGYLKFFQINSWLVWNGKIQTAGLVRNRLMRYESKRQKQINQHNEVGNDRNVNIYCIWICNLSCK